MDHGKSQLDFAGGAEGEQEEATTRNPCPGFSPALSTNCGISKAEFGYLMNWFGGNHWSLHWSSAVSFLCHRVNSGPGSKSLFILYFVEKVFKCYPETAFSEGRGHI